MWGYLIAGVVTLLALVVASIVVFAQAFWLPILIVGAAVAVTKTIGSYRRSRDDSYGLPPA